jgi:hypothetical protein
LKLLVSNLAGIELSIRLIGAMLGEACKDVLEAEVKDETG